MRRPGIIPDEQLKQVVTAIYDAAEDAGWENLSLRDRSRMYGDWVEALNVGEVLTRYMTPEAARSWIKDGPMKEYARANRGAGRYAEFGRQGGTEVIDVVRVALGPMAEIEDESERVKPFRCYARTADSRALVTWGGGRNFKDLLWAALKTAAEEKLAAHIVVMEPPGVTTSASDRAKHEALTRRCDLGLHYMREVLGTRTRQGRA